MELNNIYSKNLSEPWFSYVLSGKKTIEGRVNRGDYANMCVGDKIWFTNTSAGYERKIKTTIDSIATYTTLEEYLLEEGLSNCLPDVSNISDGVSIYNNIYKNDTIELYGIKAFRIRVI